MDATVRRGLRVVLSLLPVAGSALALFLAWNGQLRFLSAVVICLLAVPAVRSLPGGSRAASWLFAVWVGLTLAFLARVDIVEQAFRGQRARLALAGGLAYLVLAASAFWACAGDGKGRRGK